MPKHVYGISAMVERNLGTKYLHPFSARERASANISVQTVPWPINGTIIGIEAEIGTALHGGNPQIAAAPLGVAIFKNESLEATSVISVNSFESKVTQALSIVVGVGDRISIRLQQTTPGQSWRSFVNVRFIFETLFRGTVIGGGTGEMCVSGTNRVYPSLGIVDPVTFSGIVRNRISNNANITNFHVYKVPASGSAEFHLKRNEEVILPLTFSGTQDSTDETSYVLAGDSMGLDIITTSGLIQMSWSALMVHY